MITKIIDRIRGIDIRRRQYAKCFETDEGLKVLADLEKFCMGEGCPFDKDPYVTALKCGRQEVYQRILTYLNLTDDQIQKMKENQNG